MQYITKLFLLVLLFSSQAAFAQKKELKTKFGKISDEEMALKSCQLDPTAPAVILFDKGSVRHRYIENKDRFIQEYERHVRIKIFNKEAYTLADQHIFYFESQKVSDLKATCYNVENGKMVEIELAKGNIFDEKLTKTRNLRKFTIPAVKEGSIIEFKYSITSENVGSIPDWTFQRVNVPTLWSEYDAEVPTFIDFSKISRGATPFLLAEEEQIPKSLNITWTERGEGLTGSSKMHTERVQYDSKNMHFIQENVPALKPEPFMAAPHDFLSEINFDIRAIYRTSIQPVAGAWQITNGGYTEYNNNWPHFGKEMLSDVYDDALKSSKYTEEIAQKVVAGKNTPLEKVTALYEYIGTNFATNRYDMIWMPQTIENLTKFKKGTPTELNILLINMLRKAGTTAYPVLISTRSNGRVNPFRVSPDELNRVIVAVENEDQTLFLVDASAYPNPIGLLEEEDFNNEGLLLKSETEIDWIPITNKISTKTFIVADLSIPTAGGSKGTISVTEGGYGAVKNRLLHREKGEKELPTLTSKEWASEATLSNIKTENMDKWNQQLYHQFRQ